MEDNYQQSLSSFRDEVKKIKDFGREMQLSEEEIRECAKKALATELETTKEKYQRYLFKYIEELKPLFKDLQAYLKTFKYKSHLTKTSKVILFLVMLYVLMYIYNMMFGLEGPFGKIFAPIFMPYDHSCMRLLRLLALPLHTAFNIATWHNSPCVMYNPLYTEYIPENCWNCDRVNRTKVAISNKIVLPSAALTRPTKFQNYTQDSFTLKNVTELINQHYEILNVPSVVLLKSTVPWLKRPIDLVTVEDIEDKIMKSPKFHLQWLTRDIRTSQVLRKLFPRPKFISKKSEVTLVRQLVIDGPGADSYLLTDNAEGNIVYLQHTGNRTLSFVAKPGCEQKCVPFKTEVGTGDIVSLPNIWDVYVTTNEESLSIASISYVDIR